MHICPQELMPLMMMLPFAGAIVAWLRSKLKRKKTNE